MNQALVDKMKAFEELLRKDYREGLTSKEKRQKTVYRKWYKSLDNQVAMEICRYLHNRK